jgi:hypothetical protein
MKVIVFVKASKESEAGVMPSQRLLSEMGKYNEELVKAGIMLAGAARQYLRRYGVAVGSRVLIATNNAGKVEEYRSGPRIQQGYLYVGTAAPDLESSLDA